MNRNEQITRRLISLPTQGIQDWVLAEATAQFRNAPRLDDLDFMDFLENGLDLAKDSDYVEAFPHNLCRACLSSTHAEGEAYCNTCA